MKTNFNEIASEIHQGNVSRGFYDKPVEFGTQLMLIVSELSEALEADRKGRHVRKANLESFAGVGKDYEGFKGSFEMMIKDRVEDELADTFIRLFDLAGYLGIDLDEHIRLKLEYNATRGYRHGKKY